MSLITTPYFHIECNGPAPTPMHDHCTATVDGSFSQAAVEADARSQSWGGTGRSWFCPRHIPATASASGSKPRRKSTESESEAAAE